MSTTSSELAAAIEAAFASVTPERHSLSLVGLEFDSIFVAKPEEMPLVIGAHALVAAKEMVHPDEELFVECFVRACADAADVRTSSYFAMKQLTLAQVGVIARVLQLREQAADYYSSEASAALKGFWGCFVEAA